MVTFCCNRCKKAIDEDDIEAIEVRTIYSRMLFPIEKEEFDITKKNSLNKNQNLHYCGECKEHFYDLI